MHTHTAQSQSLQLTANTDDRLRNMACLT